MKSDRELKAFREFAQRSPLVIAPNLRGFPAPAGMAGLKDPRSGGVALRWLVESDRRLPLPPIGS